MAQNFNGVPMHSPQKIVGNKYASPVQYLQQANLVSPQIHTISPNKVVKNSPVLLQSPVQQPAQFVPQFNFIRYVDPKVGPGYPAGYVKYDDIYANKKFERYDPNQQEEEKDDGFFNTWQAKIKIAGYIFLILLIMGLIAFGVVEVVLKITSSSSASTTIQQTTTTGDNTNNLNIPVQDSNGHTYNIQLQPNPTPEEQHFAGQIQDMEKQYNGPDNSKQIQDAMNMYSQGNTRQAEIILFRSMNPNFNPNDPNTYQNVILDNDQKNLVGQLQKSDPDYQTKYNYIVRNPTATVDSEQNFIKNISLTSKDGQVYTIQTQTPLSQQQLSMIQQMQQMQQQYQGKDNSVQIQKAFDSFNQKNYGKANHELFKAMNPNSNVTAGTAILNQQQQALLSQIPTSDTQYNTISQFIIKHPLLDALSITDKGNIQVNINLPSNPTLPDIKFFLQMREMQKQYNGPDNTQQLQKAMDDYTAGNKQQAYNDLFSAVNNNSSSNPILDDHQKQYLQILNASMQNHNSQQYMSLQQYIQQNPYIPHHVFESLLQNAQKGQIVQNPTQIIPGNNDELYIALPIILAAVFLGYLAYKYRTQILGMFSKKDDKQQDSDDDEEELLGQIGGFPVQTIVLGVIAVGLCISIFYVVAKYNGLFK